MTASTPTTKTALIIGDVQRGIVKNFGDDETLLNNVSAAAAAARAAGVPVIYVKVGFRPGHPEISSRNTMWSGVATAGGFVETADPTQIHDAVAPQDGDIVVTKRRVGAFSGSDLDLVLRSLEVTDVAITGIATSGVVLSTVRAAADLDYRLVVLSDATKDADDEVYRVLIEKVFPRQAEVLNTDEWVARISSPSAR